MAVDLEKVEGRELLRRPQPVVGCAPVATYRNDLESAQLRVNTLEAKLVEKDAELAERDAALAAREAEVEELRREVARAAPLPPDSAAARRKSASRRLLFVGLGAGTAVALVVLVMMLRVGGPAEQPSRAATPPVSVASAPVPPPEHTGAGDGTPSPPPGDTAASASGAGSGHGAAVDETLDPATLPSHEGLLEVRFSGPSATVYLMGKAIGNTGERLRARCGKKLVRLGTPAGGSGRVLWVSAGRSIDVRCQALTVVELQPQQ